MTSCTNCGADNPAGVKFCKQCGTPISAPAVVPPCVSCGADLPAGAKFCKKCGTPVAAIDTAATAPSMPSPGKAIEKLTTVTEQVIPPVIPAAELPPELQKLPEPAPAPLPENPVVQAGLAFEPAAAPESVPARALAPEPAPAPAPVSTPSPVAGQPPLIEEKSFEKSTPPLPDNAPYGLPATPKKSDQKQLKMIVAGVVVVALIAGGLFWWHSAKKPVPVEAVSAELPAPIVDSAPVVEKDIPASPTLPDLGKPSAAASVAASPPASAATASAPDPIPAQVPAAPQPIDNAPAMAPMRPQPVPIDPPRPPKIVKPAPQADPMAGTIATLLGKAENYTANGQYDKAIATAESVLAIEPGNRAAKSAISKAKARQMDALKSNSSLE